MLIYGLHQFWGVSGPLYVKYCILVRFLKLGVILNLIPIWSLINNIIGKQFFYTCYPNKFFVLYKKPHKKSLFILKMSQKVKPASTLFSLWKPIARPYLLEVHAYTIVIRTEMVLQSIVITLYTFFYSNICTIINHVITICAKKQF